MSNEILNNSNDNNKKKKLTIEKLRKFEGFENISDSEAEGFIRSYGTFSLIAYKCFQKQIVKT
jgi:hypothetical protein